MVIIPAVDLYKGKVVRMIKGKKDKVIYYDYEPIKLMEEFLSFGFKMVHLIDLSSAIDNSNENAEILEEVSRLGLVNYVEIGGGIRSLNYSLKLREKGFKRQIITSLIVRKPDIIPELVKNEIEVIFGLDTDRKTEIKISGWQNSENIDLFKFLNYVKEQGVKEIIHTDTSADGTLKGRDLEFTIDIIQRTSLTTIVAGGISSISDIEKVLEISNAFPLLKGVIVGRAFYEKKISIEELSKYAC
ncbi:MAG: phosphoribosylformimino-5-aminoimidazole carboxamide ribotide isomerase [Thermotogaceae bacterium]|jgi:phosphoribosylformimino-5-aminoimidazole carboxamide ribotide isomerase|nr:phosphoribosylformimino-5-aminoimidazole carboxamide ribotide isomerase [Thermotogaceae bacterium]MDN5336933.1 phosphoribosylformimino-5-aminoimidazole carboxamide ribotide isomerase [Thermotogaceae bacterium]